MNRSSERDLREVPSSSRAFGGKVDGIEQHAGRPGHCRTAATHVGQSLSRGAIRVTTARRSPAPADCHSQRSPAQFFR